MGLVNGSFPSLINGVSQQPDSLRLPTQGVEQINGMSSLMEGLGKRPPTTHIAKIDSSNYIYPYVHYIDRDETERYVMMVYPDRITVFGTDGTAYPVYGNVSDFTYLQCQYPNQSIKCLTIEDTTFVLNRTVATRINPVSRTPNRTAEALIWVRAGNYKTKYNITLAGNTVTYETSATDPATIQTSFIALQLYNLLIAIGAITTDYNVTLKDSTIWINRKDGLGFVLETSDTNGNHNMSLIIGSAQHFSDLPDVAPLGYQVKVLGNIESNSDDYWVRFQTNGQLPFSKGLWQESARPFLLNDYDATVMPHRIVRTQDVNGTVTGVVGKIYFQFSAAPWSKRVCGDDLLNPPASFLTKKISDIFLHRNRLGILSGGSITMSQSGNLYNFWRQTATTLLDDDVIDVTLAHHRAVNLRHGISFNQELVLFADHTQFVVAGADILSPKTISVSVATEYSNQLNTPPVHAENMLYFAFDDGEFAGVREYYIQGITNQKNAKDITSHCSHYIQGSIQKITVAPILDMLFALTTTNRNKLWVYRWFWNGQDKMQSSWSQWVFGPTTTVIGCGFLGDVMYLVNVNSDGTYLEKMRLDPGHTDDYAPYLTHLDRRVTESQTGVQTFYDAVANTTTILPPYQMDPTDEWQVISRASPDLSWIPGRVVTQISHDRQRIVVQGDVRRGFWLGRKYEFRYIFSKALLHSTTPIGGVDSIAEGRLQVKDWLVKYYRTGYFRAEVTADYRDPATYPLTGQVVKVPDTIYGGIGRVQVRDGVLRFPVQAQNNSVKIEIINDSPLPSNIVGAEWVGNFWSKARRI